MRRDSNRRQRTQKSFEDKILISGGIILLLIIGLIIGLSVYSNSLKNNSLQGGISSEQIASLVPNDQSEDTITTETESASTSIGKSVEESKNEISNNTQNTITNTTTSTTKKKSTSTSKKTSNESNITSSKNPVTEEKKEITFIKPVEGDIYKEFAKDNLVYSETLKEWVTHLGVDIKAEKTTVVKAATDGTIKSIKNDPRYGLTVIIDHDDGYQTIYSNLLTAEFVVEGEKVKQGQSIGTVGNTAVFEISDESHLHFELLKDSENLDPSIYIK